MENKINVGIVEDQLLFREGMKAILGTWPDINMIFESADGYSVLDKLKSLPELPEVMLVDLSLPPMGNKVYSGANLTRDLIANYPAMKILILSVHQDDSFIAQLIEIGAHAYLIKESDPLEVHEAIVALHRKGTYINEKSLKAIQSNMGKKQKAKARVIVEITKREEDILRLTCQQYTAEEIATKLFISVKTVNGHRNNLLQKTGSRNVTGLVIYAIKNQIVDLI